jgi:hypothetical protein
MRGDMKGVMSGVSSVFKSTTGGGKKAEEISRQTRTSPADVVCSACACVLLLGLINVVRFLGADAKTRKPGVYLHYNPLSIACLML